MGVKRYEWEKGNAMKMLPHGKPGLKRRDGRHGDQTDCSPGRTIRLQLATTCAGFT